MSLQTEAAPGPDPATARGTLLDRFDATARAHPDGAAVRYFDASLSYGELDALSDGFAAWLVEHGVGRGDRVGVILQNVPHLIVAVIGAWKAGAIPVPGNPMYQRRELVRLFADYAPAAIVAHPGHVSTVRAALAEAGCDVPCVVARASDWQACAPSGLLPEEPEARADDFLALCRVRACHAPPRAEIHGDDLGLLLYTSGTTGEPKGAMIRHASIMFDSETFARGALLGPESRVLAIAPMFHITGFILAMGVAFASCCPLALTYRFQAAAVLELIRDWRPTFTIGAITAYTALLNEPGVQADDFASFDRLFSGGAPIAPALRDQVEARFGRTLHPVYGLTESCAATHMAPPGVPVPVDAATGALSAGLALPLTETRIAGPDGTAQPTGVAGEVWMRGPQMMAGYWRKPEETTRALTGGWLHTGDIGLLDEHGWLYIVDREKDMINASGFKVWPREVEDVLLEHPAVREAAVVGAPDAYRGETVIAYVSRCGGASAGSAELIRHCRERLAAYKAPARVIVRDELPKTLTGKLQRAALRADAAERVAAARD